tara:strand:- start:596 stop:1627 length:1032 start_codon:yes stop_codon:yes gene_type:complete
MTTWQAALDSGQVIPACPLALNEDRTWSERHQRALFRYYIAAGAGGVAVGVHTTQFEIRNPKYGLYEPVLRAAADVLNQHNDRSFVRVAGIAGHTNQAVAEASLAADLGFHCGLLNLSALKDENDDAKIAHCKEVCGALPVFGFYLHPGAGGCILGYEFWQKFCELPNVVAIKIAAFNRYQTWDVVRAVIESGRTDITLYTGNDDNIINDLLTPFRYRGVTRRFAGGLLGQWALWTRSAVRMLNDIKQIRNEAMIPSEWLSRNVELTDANSVIFDAAHEFSGCIPGVNELLRREGLLPSTQCLDPDEVLSPGQAAELDRICAAYPHLTDGDYVSAHVAQWLDE